MKQKLEPGDSSVAWAVPHFDDDCDDDINNSTIHGDDHTNHFDDAKKIVLPSPVGPSPARGRGKKAPQSRVARGAQSAASSLNYNTKASAKAGHSGDGDRDAAPTRQFLPDFMNTTVMPNIGKKTSASYLLLLLLLFFLGGGAKALSSTRFC